MIAVKKVLSFVLTCVMVVGLFPTPALAEAIEETEAIVQQDGSSTEEDGGPTEADGGPTEEGGSTEADGGQEQAPVQEVPTEEDDDVVLSAQATASGIEIGTMEEWGFSANKILDPALTYVIQASGDNEGWTNEADTIKFNPTETPIPTGTMRGHSRCW